MLWGAYLITINYVQAVLICYLNQLLATSRGICDIELQYHGKAEGFSILALGGERGVLKRGGP